MNGALSYNNCLFTNNNWKMDNKTFCFQPIVFLLAVNPRSRLLAVPFWIVERAREIAERKTGAPIFRSAISRALSTIQKGTASSLSAVLLLAC